MNQTVTSDDAAGGSACPPWWRSSWAGMLLVLVFMVVAYGPALRGGYIWDDDEYVTGNDTLLSADGLWRIWSDPSATPQYYPLVHTSFWIEQHLWGLNPAAYHWTNVLLHALNAVLVWRVLRRLSVPGAWLAAAVFALHPVHVESVAWITERKNVLSGAFGLGALLAWLRFAGLGGDRGDDRRDWNKYAVTFLLFACALLSKTVTATLPAVMVLLLWWKRGRVKWTDVWPLIPMFALGAGLGLLTAWLERHHVGATGADWDLSRLQRCLIAGRALWFYAGKLLWPAPLTFIYPRWEVSPGVAWQFAFPVAAALVLAVLWALRGRIGRGPLVGLLCFAGTLFPALGFFDVYPMRYSFVADHFQYLASIGLLAVAAAALTLLAGRLKPRWPWAGAALASAWLLALGALSWRQSRIYHSAEALWIDTLNKNPGCWMAHANLGLEYLKTGRLDQAISHCGQSIDIRPDNVEARTNLANALFQNGQTKEAVAQYETALEINPRHLTAHNNLGHVLLQLGRVDDAIGHFEDAVEIHPNFAEAHNNLSMAFLKKGDAKAAIASSKKALEIRPDYAEAFNNLGNVFLVTGRLDEAAAQYRKAIEVRPAYSEAWHNLGNAFLQSGRTDEAIVQYFKALEISPNLPETLNNLGSACLQKGRLDDAIAHYRKAVAIRPDFVDARFNLASALSNAGKMEDAIAELRKVTELRPDFAPGHSGLARALLQSGQVAGAIGSFETALKINPDDVHALVTLAWVLSASPEAALRNGSRAVEMGRHAIELSKGGDPLALRSLAAAYAESGRMREALETAQLAVDAASIQGNTALAESAKEERKLYWEGRPMRDSRLQRTPNPAAKP